MEGKGLLFKIYAGIDVFRHRSGRERSGEIHRCRKKQLLLLSAVSIWKTSKLPNVSKIERRLKEELDIPVMHDDQHGTAIISSAGLVKCPKWPERKSRMKIVVNGAGASAVSCTKLYVSLGARLENIVMLDSKGVISKTYRPQRTEERFCHRPHGYPHIGRSDQRRRCIPRLVQRCNVLSQDMVRSMAPMPIVFALAKPDTGNLLRRYNEAPAPTY